LSFETESFLWRLTDTYPLDIHSLMRCWNFQGPSAILSWRNTAHCRFLYPSFRVIEQVKETISGPGSNGHWRVLMNVKFLGPCPHDIWSEKILQDQVWNARTRLWYAFRCEWMLGSTLMGSRTCCLIVCWIVECVGEYSLDGNASEG
jgi:hypothetical protein